MGNDPNVWKTVEAATTAYTNSIPTYTSLRDAYVRKLIDHTVRYVEGGRPHQWNRELLQVIQADSDRIRHLGRRVASAPVSRGTGVPVQRAEGGRLQSVLPDDERVDCPKSRIRGADREGGVTITAIEVFHHEDHNCET